MRSSQLAIINDNFYGTGKIRKDSEMVDALSDNPKLLGRGVCLGEIQRFLGLHKPYRPSTSDDDFFDSDDFDKIALVQYYDVTKSR